MQWLVSSLSIVKGITGAKICIPAPTEILNKIDSTIEYVVEIKKNRKHRSLTANAYCWQLCSMIAKELTKNGVFTTKEDVYRTIIRNCDVYDPVYILESSVSRYIEIWQRKGLGWVVEQVGGVNTKGYVLLHCYYGSSTYNTEEMSRLIDSLLVECNTLGIETKSAGELQSLIETWVPSYE